MSGGRGRWRGAAPAPAGLAALALAAVAAAAAAQPPEPESWLRVDSPHFTLYSDADPERAAEIAGGLERLRDAFARLSPGVSLRSPVPIRIVAFREGESFAGYKTIPDRGSLKVLGQFLAHREANFIVLDADPSRVGALATIHHEYVHELVQHNFPRVPLWFNEGLAEYYSTFAVEGGVAFVGRPVERHMRWLRGHPDFSLAEVLAATRESAARHDSAAAGQLYAVSWLLVHYLLSGDGERLAGAAELLFRLELGDEPGAALEAALGVGAVELAERLRDYLMRPLPQGGLRLPARASPAPSVAPVAAADLLTALGDLLLYEQRPRQAERHYDLALAYDGFHAAAHSGLAAVRDLEARLDESAVLHREALRLDPQAGLAHLRYGRHLMTRAQAAPPAAGEADGPEGLAGRARELLARAADLEPEFAECRALLGAAHLLPGGEPERGIVLLEEVRRELPERSDVVFNLLQLYLADEQIAEAAALLGGPLARLADDELVARAREAVERSALLKAAREALAEGQVGEGLRLLDRALEVTSDEEMRAAIATRRAAIERQSGRRR